MANNMFNMINADNKPNLFNSMFGGSSSSQGLPMIDSLNEFSSIKSGSYAKLLKSYYAKQTKADSTEKSEEVKTAKTEMSKVKTKAADLKDAATALYSDKTLFEKKEITTTDKDGNKTKTTDYDRDEINKAVNSYVDTYNSLLKTAGNSDDKSVTSAVKNTVKRTSANSKLLSKVGITIGKDNKLSVNQDKLKEASISDLKSLFSGRGSYAYNISSNASGIANYSSGKMSDSSLYTNRAMTYPDVNAYSMEYFL